MRVKITPGQGLYLFGFFGIKESLTWNDILQDESLTFDRLLSANLTPQQLYNIQPDTMAWVQSKKALLHNCPAMVNFWNAQAIADFKADLGEIILMKWPIDTMIRVGVNYDTLLDIGLTPENMVLMSHVTLLGWSQLGFSLEHAKGIQEATLLRLFGLSKSDVLRSLKPMKIKQQQ